MAKRRDFSFVQGTSKNRRGDGEGKNPYLKGRLFSNQFSEVITIETPYKLSGFRITNAPGVQAYIGRETSARVTGMGILVCQDLSDQALVAIETGEDGRAGDLWLPGNEWTSSGNDASEPPGLRWPRCFCESDSWVPGEAGSFALWKNCSLTGSFRPTDLCEGMLPLFTHID